jgi:hypothetical protein
VFHFKAAAMQCDVYKFSRQPEQASKHRNPSCSVKSACGRLVARWLRVFKRKLKELSGWTSEPLGGKVFGVVRVRALPVRTNSPGLLVNISGLIRAPPSFSINPNSFLCIINSSAPSGLPLVPRRRSAGEL